MTNTGCQAVPAIVIPDLIRDPVLHGPWIAGQARNDNE